MRILFLIIGLLIIAAIAIFVYLVCGRKKNAKNEKHPLNPTNKAPENGSGKKYGQKEHQPLSFPNHKKKDATNLMDEAQINDVPNSSPIDNGHPAKKNLSKQQHIDNTDQHPPKENVEQPNKLNLSNQSEIHIAEEEGKTIINVEHPTEKKDEDICMICEYMKLTLYYELQCKHRICLWCVFGGCMKGPMMQCYKCKIEYCISNHTVKTEFPVYKLMRKIEIVDILREDLKVPSAKTKICDICKKNQNDMPMLKACEHSICRNCLVEHVKKNNENTEIPLCPVCSNELIVEEIKPRYEPFTIKFRLM